MLDYWNEPYNCSSSESGGTDVGKKGDEESDGVALVWEAGGSLAESVD